MAIKEGRKAIGYDIEKKNMWIWQIDELILSKSNCLCFVLLKATGYEYLTTFIHPN